MCTDDFEIPYAPPPVDSHDAPLINPETGLPAVGHTSRTISAEFTYKLIDNIRSALLEVGWQSSGGSSATGDIFLPGGIGNGHPVRFTSGEVPVVSDYPLRDGYPRTTTYEPGPGATFDCCGQLYGPTASLDALAAWFTACTEWDVSHITKRLPQGQGPYDDLVFTSKPPGNRTPGCAGKNLSIGFVGPYWNAPRTQITDVSSGFISPVAFWNITGGGWRLTSPPTPNGSTIAVFMTAVDPWGDLRMRITAGELSADYILRTGRRSPVFEGGAENPFGQAVPSYLLVASPHQFGMVDLANADDLFTAGATGGNSIFVSNPWTENANIHYNAIIIGPGTFMNDTVWGGFPCSFNINGHTGTYVPSSFNPRPNLAGLTVRTYSFDQPLLTTNRKPILQNAWLSAAGRRSDEAMIVGKAWGGFAVSNYYPKGSRVTYDGHQFVCVSSRSHGTMSSLFLAEN